MRIKENIICLIFSLFCFCGFSQQPEIKQILTEKADSLLKIRPVNYNDINQTFRRYQRDSSNLRFLADYFAENKYAAGESYALNHLGVHNRNVSQYQKAIELHKKAIEKAQEGKSVELEILNYNMLGVVYRRLDALRTALDNHYEALSLAENIPNPSMSVKRSLAVSSNSIGNIYLSLKQYELAIEQFSKSLEIETSIDNKLGLAINYHNTGAAKEYLGRMDEALEDYQKSLLYNLQINSKLGEVICKNSIGQIYIKQKNFVEAEKLIQSSLSIAKTLKDAFHLAGVYINLGWVQTELKQYEEAEKNLMEGLAISEEHDFTSSISEAYRLLSALHEVRGRFPQALEYHKKYQAFNEEIANEKNSQYVNDLIIKYDAEKKNTQIKLLAQENEIVKLKYRRNQSVWIVSLIVTSLMAILLYILYRQRMLKKEKRILTLQQKMLSSQMNPHFIFNSLNSIKLYIINNEKENAVYYLNKFSKLIRLILSNSNKQEASLAEELEFLKLYVDIENIRFDNQLNFEISVEADTDINLIKIPPLVLQPFIENAIWHGLSSKEGEKNIHLFIKSDEKDYITISVVDNGIGREKAQQIKASKIVKDESVGVMLSISRLQHFSNNLNHKAALLFNDLFDKQKGPSGTEVIIKLPLT
ncbi:tetratricopeptide repeat protein [Leptobacterium flavescens]|uniref:Tetratricopeptide repeat protein n=1 Tax=Leptobacterium flavescens TaxID=472055 RepID=A0A6P0UN18_9FLAO|nr:tetratricopeptide repeat protein [Leptobacterium flavescens]NER12403.1 tetratricopeptide repeat protein [Leptobacterium flavescens]